MLARPVTARQKKKALATAIVSQVTKAQGVFLANDGACLSGLLRQAIVLKLLSSGFLSVGGFQILWLDRGGERDGHFALHRVVGDNHNRVRDGALLRGVKLVLDHVQRLGSFGDFESQAFAGLADFLDGERLRAVEDQGFADLGTEGDIAKLDRRNLNALLDEAGERDADELV